VSKNFFIKKLGEATYILDIEIYRDRFRKLLKLSQSMPKVWKNLRLNYYLFCMEHLSSKTCSKTQIERDMIEMVSSTWL
jgi:hypothetical protein